MKVGSFYKKSLLTRGVEKANQVMKRQKAQAEIEKALQKQAANTAGTYLNNIVSLLLIQLLLFSELQFIHKW